MTVSEIRKAFLDFFKSKGHSIVPSSSLIPSGDPTLLFTTAGMVQFKPLFTGAVELPYTRAASSQKCLRTTDLENIGKTERHCTFFEMLGNFSFGDYFKKEAIEYALDFSVNTLGFDINKIWITVYLDDEEAIELWVKAGIPRNRIVKLGKSDNFWGPAGDSGACGPCSELYLDRGAEKGNPGCGTKDSCKPGCSCDRFLEYWNLVFNQFNQDVNGVLHPLKQTGIDTGSGLERVALLIQGVDSVYDTDELKRIINKIGILSGATYDEKTKSAFRVLTDHCRSVVFAIGDGIYPDKTGRGYVIRRLIRRASLYARKLNIREPFLYKLVNELISIYSSEYSYLKSKESEIERIIHGEETLFLNTLELGISQMDYMIESYAKSGQILFSGKDIFKLYGTYGFPPEMTREILLEKGLEFDKSGFEKELENDRNLSRESWKGKKIAVLSSLKSKVNETKFLGYNSTKEHSAILNIIKNNEEADSIQTGESGYLILDSTVFYAESGGQLGDKGYIKNGNSIFQVNDTQKENDIYIHIGTVLSGEFKKNSSALCEVDERRRELLTYHHSGTHLLHGALRSILGTHVSQKASLVSSEYLRFDFSHPNPMTKEELAQVEDKVNFAIGNSVSVSTRVLPAEEAKKTGAMAFFEDKYGDSIRVVQMGEFSIEFCGGCHVNNTKNIEYFLIKKESSPGAGNRRIEAVCGPVVVDYFQEAFQVITQKIQEFHLKSKEAFPEKYSEFFIKSAIPDPDEIRDEFYKHGASSVKKFRERKESLENELQEKSSLFAKEKKKLEDLESKTVVSKAEELILNSISIGDIKFIFAKFDDGKIEALKELGDSIKNRLDKCFISILLYSNNAISLLYMTNKNSLSIGIDCNKLLKSTTGLIQGRGGGKPDMAQGGGKIPESPDIIKNHLIQELKKIIGE